MSITRNGRNIFKSFKVVGWYIVDGKKLDHSTSIDIEGKCFHLLIHPKAKCINNYVSFKAPTYIYIQMYDTIHVFILWSKFFLMFFIFYL